MGNTETFIEQYPFIISEIKKRRGKWSLTAIHWMDYNDVSQIIVSHIWQKWYQYKPERGSLGPWLNKIIENQIKNLIRDKYGNYSRPCLRCRAAMAQDECYLYGLQCSDCPLYSNWENGGKKDAYHAKLPVSIEMCKAEVCATPDPFFDFEGSISKLHEKIKKHLKKIEWKVYKLLYIDHKSEYEVAQKMGYITNEANRLPGYRQIKNLKKAILIKAKKVIKEEDVI